MRTDQLIRIEEFCLHHEIDMSFVTLLHENGIVTLTVVEENFYLVPDQLSELEKMIRLHYDLEINLEGLQVISNLLKAIDQLHEERRILKNRLERFSIE